VYLIKVEDVSMRCDISLASRRALCINEDVLKLKSNNRINDACLDLKKKKSEKKHAGSFRSRSSVS